MTGTGKKRAFHVCLVLVTLFTVYSARLVYLQVTRHEYFVERAAETHITKKSLYAPRGSIYDVNGEILAVSEPLKSVIADPSIIKDPQAMAEALSDLLEMPADEIRRKIESGRERNSKYVPLKHKVLEVTASKIAQRLSERRLRGILFEQTSRRVYPNGTMLSHVLGFLNREENGVQGVEMTMNHYLRGQHGYRYTERDRLGRELVAYRGEERPPRDGYNVRLTIDMALQAIVEEELDAAFREYRPEMATAIMMEPKTGRILAIANRPTFDPNFPGEGKGQEMKNAAIVNLVEPGSTFKIVTTVAALNDKVVDLDTIINCENGRFHFAGKVLRDHGHGPFPNLSVADVLIRSSNIGVAKLAMKMGEQRFYEYLRRFGFGERTGIALPGEIPGMLAPPHKWSKISISRIPMGQGVATTPLQMVAAMAAIANGGYLMLPQIVDSVIDNDGNTIVEYKPVVVRQVVDKEATDKVKIALRGVVSRRGTARGAAVEGFSVGGKTGTAQKANPNGGYYDHRYVTSFIGIMPVDDPAFVCMVLFDDAKVPESRNYGGVLAAPVFARIAQRAARHLNLKPDLVPESDNSAIQITQATR